MSRPIKSNRLQSFSSKALFSGDGNGVESSSTAEDGLDDVAVPSADVDNLSSNTSDASCCSSFIVVYDSDGDGNGLDGDT